jgi:hypothetical protein
MSLTRAQGLLLSNDWLLARFIEDAPFVMQLAQELPFFEIDGDSERFSPTDALPAAPPVGFCVALTEQSTIPKTRSYSFGMLGTQRTVCYSTQYLQSNVNDQTLAQTEMACRNLLYGFWTLFITGNPATAGEFAGLDTIISGADFAGQIIDAAGTPVTTALLDRALRLIRSGEGYADKIYTSPDGYNAIREAYFVRGTSPQQQAHIVPNGNGGARSMWTTHVDGVPVVWSHFVPVRVGPPKVTDIWFLKMGRRHLHGMVPMRGGGRRSMIKIQATLGAGLTRYDLVFPVAIAVPSVSDIAVIRNVLVP